MSSALKKSSRGRPQTLDRNHVLKVAMENYWTRGSSAVSINEICKLAEVSKPGLYREFGNEDAFKKVVLTHYEEVNLLYVYEMLENEKSLKEVISLIIDYFSTDRKKLELPYGCMHNDMCMLRDNLGPLAKEKTDNISNKIFNLFEELFKKAKAKGELNFNISATEATIYVRAQINSVMHLQKDGADREACQRFLRLAFSVLYS